ncbi:MAG: threonine dehydratase [Pseudomonadota bacterium]
MNLSSRDLISEPLRVDEFEAAQALVYDYLKPTPEIQWPLLSEALNCEVWVKHENHLPTGAFKVRGGLWYQSQLVSQHSDCPGVIAATRGNHGQSVAFAARHFDLRAVVVVPFGNSVDKNRAMKALGAELIEQGKDFDEALVFARTLVEQEGLHFMPSFNATLVQGVGTYALELFSELSNLDYVFVPIGLGSGICGTVAVRDALGLDTKIIGVVASGADAYRRSLQSGRSIATDAAETIADGLAVRIPNDAALAYIKAGVESIVAVNDEQILGAMKLLYETAHNVAEGAGSASIAALMSNQEIVRGKRVGVVLSGGNVDASLFQQALRS